MKKALFVLLLLTPGLLTFSQVKEPDALVIKSLPKDTRAITQEEFTSFSHQQFNYFQQPLGDQHFYKKEGMLLSYRNSEDIPVTRHSLESKQQQWVSLFKKWTGTSVNESRIVTINNTRFLIIDYVHAGDGFLDYTSDYNSKIEFVYGHIQYKLADKQKATQLLQDWLQTIQLKD